MNDIGVIICSDGGNYILNQEFLDKYSYDIKYVICEHRGVSATRNSAFLLSDADYVMYCDSDDGFCNILGVKIILENIKQSEEKGEPFDILSSKFFGENNISDKWSLQLCDHNNIYIHGRVYRRDFLARNSIYFNEKIWANEDCFFNIFTNFCSTRTALLDTPVYCWRENVNSVTHDPKYIMKTMHQLIYSNDSVVEVMTLLGKTGKDIANTIFDLICKVYLEMNKPEWHLAENIEYKDITIKTLKWYINKRGDVCKNLSDDEKKNVLQKARETTHYGAIESITFNDFIQGVMKYE